MKATISSNELIRFEKESKVVKADAIVIHATEVVELVKCDDELNNQVKATIHADVFEGGSLVLPKEVFPLLKKDHPVTISDSQIIIGSRVININLQPGEGYPRIDGEFNNKVFELPDSELKQLLEVEHCISSDLTKPILTGIRIEGDKFITIDGFKMAVRKGNFKSAKSMSISNHKILKALKGNIKATCNEKHINYQVGNYNYTNSLLEGDFIQWQKLVSKDHHLILKVNKNELLEVLKSMNEVLKKPTIVVDEDGKKSKRYDNKVILDIYENQIEISAKNIDMEIKDIVNCQAIEFNRLKIAFNCSYLIDCIKTLDDEIELSFTTNVNPVVIKSGDKFELLLPIRISSVN